MAHVIEFLAARDYSHPKETLTLYPKVAAPVVPIFESRTWQLRQLHQKILSSEALQLHSLLRGSYVRPFRQEFCRIARKHSGYSIEELCYRLNSDRHLRWRLQELLRHYWQNFYPFTPEFVSNLESNIKAIPEYTLGGGFAFCPPPGVPTCEIAGVLADICGMRKEYEKFQGWCWEFQFNERERKM